MHRRFRRAIVGLILVGALLVVGAAYAAFSSTTFTNGNTTTAGTVVLTDNDSGSALFSTAADGPLKIGQTLVKCVNVTYSGSLATTAIRLYISDSTNVRDPANPTGTGPRDYVHMKVEEGTGASTFGSCAGFSATGVLWNPGAAADSMTAFPFSYATGVVTATGWTAPATRSYRFTLNLDDATPDAAEGGTATATFTWEARNS